MRKSLLMAFLLMAVTVAAKDGKKIKLHFQGDRVEVKNSVKGVTVKCQKAHVVITNTLTEDELTLSLSGQSDNGSVSYTANDAKTTVVLNGVKLKTEEGAALDLQCKKRVKLKIADGTVNSLTDGVDTLHKACIYAKGKLEIRGGGTLNVVGRSKNGISSKKHLYIEPTAGNIHVTTETGNGLNSGKDMLIEGGTLRIDLKSEDKKGLKSDSLMILRNCTIAIEATGNGGKGISSGGDLVLDKAKLEVNTSGSYISEKQFGFGGFGGPPMGEGMDSLFQGFGGPGGFGGFPPMGEGMDSLFQNFGGGFPPMMGEFNDSIFRQFFQGGRPPRMGERNDSTFQGFPPMMGEFNDSIFKNFGGGFGGFPPMGEFNDSLFQGGPPMMGFGGFGQRAQGIQLSDSVMNVLFGDIEEGNRGDMMGGRHHYAGTAKAVKAKGSITMNGGNVRLTTQSPGAEGLEGKQGITINDGTLYVKAQDDAVNSGGKITFNGGDVFVWSVGNDAIDSNSRGAGAITLAGGKVVSCSQLGPPDEPFDCDFSPMILTGGTIFGMGGSMGGSPTVPESSSDTQPTVVLNNLPCPQGKTLVCIDQKTGKTLFSIVFPFTMRQSASILSCPAFKIGRTYEVRIKETDTLIKQFTFGEVICQ